MQFPAKTTWTNGVEALKDALKTEASVTKSIRQVIQKCENDNTNNDYHVRSILEQYTYIFQRFFIKILIGFIFAACRLLDW